MSEHEHVFATPGPAGLSVLAFYLGCLWPVATHMAPHDAILILMPLGFAGALVQTIAGVIELRNGAILPGNILVTFSAFMWYGCFEHLLTFLGLLKGPTATVDGIVFLIMGLLMVGYTPCFFLKNTAGSLFMLVTDIFFLAAATFFLTGNPMYWAIAGWDLPFVIIFILWQVIGDVTNAVYGRVIYPMGPAWVKRKSA